MTDGGFKKMRVKIWVTALAVLLLLGQASRGVAHGAGSRWLACEQWIAPSSAPLLAIIHSAPEVTLFEDGRLVWLDAARLHAGEGQNPCAWRTAVISVRERIDFRQVIAGAQFYTVALPSATVGEVLPGSGCLRVAARTEGLRDVLVYARYRPDDAGSRRFVARMKETVAALRVLTQRSSECYRPSSIQVGLVPEDASADTTARAVEWPVPPVAGLAEGKIVAYQGEEARRIIDALAGTTRVTLAGRTYTAAWAPLLGVPPAPSVCGAGAAAPEATGQ